MQKPDLLPLSDADWQQTPLTSQALIVAMWSEVPQFRAEVASLREQVDQTSHNSSRPPSLKGRAFVAPSSGLPFLEGKEPGWVRLKCRGE